MGKPGKPGWRNVNSHGVIFLGTARKLLPSVAAWAPSIGMTSGGYKQHMNKKCADFPSSPRSKCLQTTHATPKCTVNTKVSDLLAFVLFRHRVGSRSAVLASSLVQKGSRSIALVLAIPIHHDIVIMILVTMRVTATILSGPATTVILN